MATPVFASSGDLIADRRYGWAQDFAKRGDFEAAADVLAQVLDAAPRFAAGWFALGIARERLGDVAGAIAGFRSASECDPDDHLGAGMHAARLIEAVHPPAMSQTYVQRLFDHYAPRFEDALVRRLDYRGPEIVLDAVRAVTSGDLRFDSVLDLGCGTGLGGAMFRPYARTLAGIDLSPGMIERARAKGLYDALAASDLLDHLAADAAACHDLVIAADVFVYCNDLVPIAAAVARVLTPG